MKDNTYVIPSIDFYIVREPEEYKGSDLSSADARSGFNRLILEQKN